MHRILLSFFMLSLTLLYAGAAFFGDEPAENVSFIGTVVGVPDANDGLGFAIEGDDGALFTSYQRHQLPSFQTALRHPSASYVFALNQPSSALIRAPPACFC